jgi:hypothetical protein
LTAWDDYEKEARSELALAHWYKSKVARTRKKSANRDLTKTEVNTLDRLSMMATRHFNNWLALVQFHRAVMRDFGQPPEKSIRELAPEQ